MNEIERAIADLQSYAKCSWGDLNDTFTLAITALREKLEREKGCEFCTGKRKYFSNLGFESTIKIASSFQGNLFLSVNGHRVEIDNCPKCGRRLEDKP